MGITGLETKEILVNYALEELVRREDRKKILKLRGKIQFQEATLHPR
jgi:adenine-specific DNA methylase